MVNKFLDTIARYRHLFNPLATVKYDPKDVTSAPVGSLRLSDDPKRNLALWNAIFVGGATLPLMYLVNTLANKHHEAKIEDKLDKAMVNKLNAMRPRVVSDPNLKDISAYTDLPEKELKQLEELKDSLSKNASEKKDKKPTGVLDSAADMLSNLFTDLGNNLIPITTVPAAALLGIGLSNYVNKKRIKKSLAERNVQLENIQAILDRKQLQESGLVKRDAAPAEDYGNLKKNANTFKNVFLDLPLITYALLAPTLGIGAFNLMRSKDKNIAKLDYLEKTHLGANTLQDTPRISVIDLPVDPSEILAVPGDARQETIIDKEDDEDDKKDNKNKKTKQLENKSGNRPLLENKELFEEMVPRSAKSKEKDAIF